MVMFKLSNAYLTLDWISCKKGFMAELRIFCNANSYLFLKSYCSLYTSIEGEMEPT